jgi:hypothetical protein
MPEKERAATRRTIQFISLEGAMSDTDRFPEQSPSDDQVAIPGSAKPNGQDEVTLERQAVITDPGNQPISKYAAPRPQITGGRIKQFTNVIPNYPRDYCRAFGDRIQHAWVIDLARANDLRKRLYLVTVTAVDAGALNGLMHKAFYAACVPMIDRDSHPHLWSVRVYDRDGNQSDIHDSAMRAVAAATEEWHRIYWSLRGYDFELARNPKAMSYRMPDNLKVGMDGWFEGAFPGRIITDTNCEELKRARGEA